MVIAMYQEFLPDRRLTPWVECGWTRSGSAPRSVRVIPDGCVDVFVGPRGDVTIAGPSTVFYDLAADEACVLAGIRLRPGAATAVLGRPVSEFTNQHVILDSVFGVRGNLIAEKVLAATTPSQRVAALQNVLTGYFSGADPLIDTEITGAIAMMRRHPGRPVSSVATAVELSERQLRRRFEAAVGYGPKRFGRILRFQHLLDLIHGRGARIRWPELAVEAHYADQAHMINECRALAGMLPTALPRGVSVSSNTSARGTS
ncbi:AraC family transcriptional regulator [Mycobacterium heidelbergense]|uniref:AraC family transcriptional regulator n=1 Tax=Mycobacterium heidelbergense TaxID=53376 RepID=UPI003CE888B9